MMLHEAGHMLGLNHPDAIRPAMMSAKTATADAVMWPTGSNHYLSAPCGPNPWALMVPGVPDGAELDPRTGVRPAAMATMPRGSGNRYRCLQPDDLEGLNAFYPPNCVGAHAPGITPTVVCPTFEHEAEFVSGSTTATTATTATIVLTLTASGSVSDYSDTSSLQQKIAIAAGVDMSLVTISVAAASVIITATITVPASMTAAALQASLSSSLGTAAAASAALGITVESDPTIKTVPEGDSDSSSMGAIIGGVGEQRPCNPAPARTPPVLPQAYHPADLAPRVACPAHSWRRACALLLLHRHRRRRLLLHEAEEVTRLRKHQYGDRTCYGAAANRGDRVSAGSTGQAGRSAAKPGSGRSAAKPGCAPCGVWSRAPRTGVRR
eukprot:scaffold29540_cov63-Phaeocystis_antarctica.AAC.4